MVLGFNFLHLIILIVLGHFLPFPPITEPIDAVWAAASYIYGRDKARAM